MAKYGMVIDKAKCVGCAACSIACKNENNVPDGAFWSHYIIETKGTFPNIIQNYTSTLCNHCDNAPCVEACPTASMTKNDSGITVHNEKTCIGCKACQIACPYDVIYFNEKEPFEEWRTGDAPKMTEKVGGTIIPYYNPDREITYPGIRQVNKVEKCNFCDHRVLNGVLPYCVEVCPANARIFGDISDVNSDVSKLIASNKTTVLKPEAKTSPNVYYINNFDVKE